MPLRLPGVRSAAAVEARASEGLGWLGRVKFERATRVQSRFSQQEKAPCGAFSCALFWR